MAAAEAVRRLRQLAFDVKRTDKATLGSIARTAMSGRSVGTNADFLADIAVEAVQSIVEEVAGELRADVDNILVQKKHGGNLKDTTLIDGVVLDKERVHPRMPKFIRDAKIALINRALEVKKTEVNEEIRIRDPAKLQMFLDEEEKTLRAMVEKIKASGANVVLAQKGIDDVAQHFLAKEGIYAVRRVKESDMKKLAKATGARSVTNLDDLTAKELGRADLVEERKVGTDDMTFVTGCKKARAVSILIRGGTEHVVDEVERILHDALRVVAAAIEDGKAISGGGSAEIELSIALKDYAATVGGREQLAIRAFGGAFARRACASGRSPFGKTSMISVHSPGSASAACRETSIRKRAATPSALTIRAGVFVRPRTRLTCAFSPSVSRALSTACSASSMDRRE